MISLALSRASVLQSQAYKMVLSFSLHHRNKNSAEVQATEKKIDDAKY